MEEGVDPISYRDFDADLVKHHHYSAAAARMLGHKIEAMSMCEIQIAPGQWGQWAYYGRKNELRMWVPREFAMMEMSRESE